MTVQSRNGGTLLVVAAITLWVLALSVFSENQFWGLAAAHAFGAAAFFGVACLLPDLPKPAFYSLKSALGATGFFSWLSALQLPLVRESNLADQENSSLRAILVITIPILLAMGVYLLSYHTIRSFRSRNEPNSEDIDK